MVFIFLFLPLVLIASFLIKGRYQNTLLLFASIIFYAWEEPRYLGVMIVTVLVNYGAAILIDQYRIRAKLILGITVLFDVSFLAYYKYFNFFIENLNLLLQKDLGFIQVALPLGISFYTFHVMSYVIDVYQREAVVQRDLQKLFLYITFFPQLVAGPIVKYHDIADQIEARTRSFPGFVTGVKRFIMGLAKKMLIANVLGVVADEIFSLQPDIINSQTAWLGALSYSLQLYFDFSGYSDMAIGLALMFGFRFPENFNYPYVSSSITEFWRRWHISLSTWFRQYLYIPLGGNRRGRWRTDINLGIVFLATGIWHGASWTFIVWGIWNGFFIILEKHTGLNQQSSLNWKRALQHMYTILVFVTGWVLFRSESIQQALIYISKMWGFGAMKGVGHELENSELLALIIGLLCSMPIFKGLQNQEDRGLLGSYILNTWLLILFLASAASIAASTYNPFIYFRF